METPFTYGKIATIDREEETTNLDWVVFTFLF